jgi:hypothetical protein
VNSWAYWNIKTDKSSVEHFDSDFPFESRLISAEANLKNSRLDLFGLAETNLADFLRRISALTPQQQDMMIEYFVLRKTQPQIAMLHSKKSQGHGVSEEINYCVGVVSGTVARRLKSKSAQRKKELRITCSATLGQFEIDMSSETCEHFASRAMQVSNQNAAVL